MTPEGFIVTEFLEPVNHAGDYNSLSRAFGHHVAEDRWLHDPQFIDQDVHFWMKSGENGGPRKNFHQFSDWAATAVYDRWQVDANRETESGLFWQRDVPDGMEESISGGRRVRNIRPASTATCTATRKPLRPSPAWRAASR